MRLNVILTFHTFHIVKGVNLASTAFQLQANCHNYGCCERKEIYRNEFKLNVLKCQMKVRRLML